MSDVTLEAAVEEFLQHKRALGRKYRSEEKELRLLTRFAQQRGTVELGAITPALLEDFLSSRPRSRPRSFNHLRGVIACLFDWAAAQQLLKQSPLRTRRRRVTCGRSPFVFDTTQARDLLSAAAALPDNARARERGLTYRCIFALCYGLGLRVGETCGLHLGDVDLERDVLVVRGGKFGKDRLVPFGPRIAELLSQQVQRRQSTVVDAHAPLFTFDGRTHVHPGTVSQTFHRLVADLDLPLRAGVSPPRLHDLRHSFAVGTLLRWYKEESTHRHGSSAVHLSRPRGPVLNCGLSEDDRSYCRRQTAGSSPLLDLRGRRRCID